MSQPCEASSGYTFQPQTTAASGFYVHVPPEILVAEKPPARPEVAIEVHCAGYFQVKPAVDRIATAVLMIVALPLMLLIGLGILLLNGTPVFYRQTRVGKDGKTFRIWKFRTMFRDAETNTGAAWSNPGDPRVTALGRWLRCSHLDELPQFFNVLTGDMNLIGPRPERPEFVRELTSDLPYYLERLKVRPGITGLAQLHVRYDQSVADVQQKVLLDLEYIRTANLLRDARLLAGTIPHIIGQMLKMLRGRAQPSGSDQHPRLVTSAQIARPSLLHPRHTLSPLESEPKLAHFATAALSVKVGSLK